MRFIARLDVKNNTVIKGINFEGLRKVGKPIDLAEKYYKDDADEILIVDCVASLYGRNNLYHIINDAVKSVFIPITLGGGIRSISDISLALDSGADKVAINTFATENPKFIEQAATKFGSSTITINIEAKKISDNYWEVYKNYGRDRTGIDVCKWIENVQNLGCGEIILTSIDKEGTETGFDLDLLSHIYHLLKVPLIFSGGCSKREDITFIKKNYSNVCVSVASIIHYNKFQIKELKL